VACSWGSTCTAGVYTLDSSRNRLGGPDPRRPPQHLRPRGAPTTASSSTKEAAAFSRVQRGSQRPRGTGALQPMPNVTGTLEGNAFGGDATHERIVRRRAERFGAALTRLWHRRSRAHGLDGGPCLGRSRNPSSRLSNHLVTTDQQPRHVRSRDHGSGTSTSGLA